MSAHKEKAQLEVLTPIMDGMNKGGACRGAYFLFCRPSILPPTPEIGGIDVDLGDCIAKDPPSPQQPELIGKLVSVPQPRDEKDCPSQKA